MTDCLEQISVGQPQVKEKNQKTYYRVVGFDAECRFECYRRYSDFAALREAWKVRIPGLFMPFLPPKENLGNIFSSKAKQQMIDDRCFGLEQFLKKVY